MFRSFSFLQFRVHRTSGFRLPRRWFSAHWHLRQPSRKYIHPTTVSESYLIQAKPIMQARLCIHHRLGIAEITRIIRCNEINVKSFVIQIELVNLCFNSSKVIKWAPFFFNPSYAESSSEILLIPSVTNQVLYP